MTMKTVERCRKIVLACNEKNGFVPKSVPFGHVVSRGVMHGLCEVMYAYPSPCVVTDGYTNVSFSKRVEVREMELQNNFVLERRIGDKTTWFVYPKKAYLEFKKLFLEPMMNGERPFSSGVLIAGPPGTGKTSLVKNVAMFLGLPVFIISPSTVLSKYVGESEEKLENLLNEALQTEPSIVLLDDAEWILKARALADSTNDVRVFHNIQNILFSRMQEVSDEGRLVVFVGTTNMKVSEIDIAFQRYGRFGMIVFIPIPDYEAAHFIISKIVDDKEQARKLAMRAINMGLSMADVIGIVERVKRGLDPEIRSTGGRGYARVYAEKVWGDNEFEKLFTYFDPEIFTSDSRIIFPTTKRFALAVMAQISYYIKRPIVFMSDVRYANEAVHMANMVNAVLVVPPTIPADVAEYIDSNAQTSVVVVSGRGSFNSPFMDVYPFFDDESIIRQIGVEAMLRAVLAYRGIKIEDSQLRRALGAARGDLKKAKVIVYMILATSHFSDKIINDASRIAERYF